MESSVLIAPDCIDQPPRPSLGFQMRSHAQHGRDTNAARDQQRWRTFLMQRKEVLGWVGRSHGPHAQMIVNVCRATSAVRFSRNAKDVAMRLGRCVHQWVATRSSGEHETYVRT